jgi:hypothetical protein
MGAVTPVWLPGEQIAFVPTDEFPEGSRRVALAASMSEEERDRYLAAIRSGDWVPITVLVER